MGRLPVGGFDLQRGEIHVWLASLDLTDDQVQQLDRCTLSPEERARAGRYRFETDRRRFVAARSQVKAILGAYLGLDAAAVRLSVTTTGKPTLSGALCAPDLRFSVSHSGPLAVCALGLGREIGVDVEHVRAVPIDARMAVRFLSRREARMLDCLSGEARQDALVAAWTRKEAYAKAIGRGLWARLDRLDVSGQMDASGWFRCGWRRHWSVRNLELQRPFTGAVAVAGRAARLRYLTWPAGGRGS